MAPAWPTIPPEDETRMPKRSIGTPTPALTHLPPP
ncbi:hypothetical protein GA0115239_100878, partial [Streptomyces sp. BpilaLS-43]